MELPGDRLGFLACVLFLVFGFGFASLANGTDLFYDWHVNLDSDLRPISVDQPVITINGMFPGPLLNTTTNDVVHVNVFNHIDEPLLITWNGIQQRLNSWQDGVSGTNCPIPSGQNYTYVFQMKDQIGTFFYFPSINFQKAAGGFGAIRVNNRKVIATPFPKPEAEFDLLVGDWYGASYKDIRSRMKNPRLLVYDILPDKILMNGKGPYKDALSKNHELFTVTQGKTYMLRISNVGVAWSFNFRIQSHSLLLVETEGSYTHQMEIDSLDVHVGQSYTVLVTADRAPADYYMVASPKMHSDVDTSRYGLGVIRYGDSIYAPAGPLPAAPDPFDLDFSIEQARSIRWNMSTGAARPNPQGTFNVSNVTLSQSFVLRASSAIINGVPRYTVNNVSYEAPAMPLKLADHLFAGVGTYQLDQYSTNTSRESSVEGVFVASGVHKGWIELVFKNDLALIDSWHLDGFGFYVVGFGIGEWTPEQRATYNIIDPVVRSTVQVYPGWWTAVYAYLDNPGMWNLRSQHLKNWYLGEELYLRVCDPDNDPAKERPIPDNVLLCGNAVAEAQSPKPHEESSKASYVKSSWFHHVTIFIAAIIFLLH